MMTLHKPKMQFTLERFIPDNATLYEKGLELRHVNRYKWAASRLRDVDLVLDAGCGTGFFDHILIAPERRIHGIDVNDQAIEYAKWKAEKDNDFQLTYEIQDLGNITMEPPPFYDAVVCIEAIEHLTDKNQQRFMESIKNLLRPSGILLVTTPTKGTATGDYHLHEFGRYEFVEFLGKYFHQIDFDDPKQFGVPNNFILAFCRGIKK